MTKYEWSPEGLSQALKEMYNESTTIDMNSLKLLETKLLVAGTGIETRTFKTKSGRKFQVQYQVEVSVHQANKNSTEGPETIKISAGQIISLIEI